jgi:integrase
MGMVYRPMTRGGTVPPAADGSKARCRDAKHGKADVCPTCGAHFGRVWWSKIYINGRCVRESTGSERETEAKRILKKREGRVANGEPVLPKVEKILYEEVAKDLRTHYKATGERELVEAGWRLAHLDPFFKARRVASIGPADVTAFIAGRQEAGASNGTVNRELGVLGRMLRLAYENGKLLRLPIIHKLTEAKPREGFFERGQFEAIKKHLRADLQVAVSVAYSLGWRLQSEVLTLKRSQVDLGACTIRLEPGTTKNDDGRLVYLIPELVTLLQAQLEPVQLLEMDLGKPVPYLFPCFKKGKHRGARVQDFRKAWRTACLEAQLDLDGLEGDARKERRAEMLANPKSGLLKMLRHDFRRTAVRNLVNRGVPERVAMKITGHKTRAVFDRYHIVSPADLQEAARKLAGTISGTAGKNNQGAALATP